jgi:hypothetical protein
MALMNCAHASGTTKHVSKIHNMMPNWVIPHGYVGEAIEGKEYTVVRITRTSNSEPSEIICRLYTKHWHLVGQILPREGYSLSSVHGYDATFSWDSNGRILAMELVRGGGGDHPDNSSVGTVDLRECRFHPILKVDSTSALVQPPIYLWINHNIFLFVSNQVLGNRRTLVDCIWELRPNVKSFVKRFEEANGAYTRGPSGFSRAVASPNDKYIAVEREEPSGNYGSGLWIYNVKTHQFRQITIGRGLYHDSIVRWIDPTKIMYKSDNLLGSVQKQKVAIVNVRD